MRRHDICWIGATVLYYIQLYLTIHLNKEYNQCLFSYHAECAASHFNQRHIKNTMFCEHNAFKGPILYPFLDLYCYPGLHQN